MKKFGLILGLVSSVIFCTSCTSNSNPNLSVSEASRWNGIVLLNYSFEDEGKPFVVHDIPLSVGILVETVQVAVVAKS